MDDTKDIQRDYKHHIVYGEMAEAKDLMKVIDRETVRFCELTRLLI